MGLTYLGCFADNGNRDLRNYISTNISPQECFKQARNRGYEFAAMQAGQHCFGDNTVGKYGSRPGKECNSECTKEKGMKCGGGWRNSVWFTGGVSYQKSTNYCVSASGKDLRQTKYKNVEKKECMEACTESAKC